MLHVSAGGARAPPNISKGAGARNDIADAVQALNNGMTLTQLMIEPDYMQVVARHMQYFRSFQIFLPCVLFQIFFFLQLAREGCREKGRQPSLWMARRRASGVRIVTTLVCTSMSFGAQAQVVVKIGF